MNTYKDVLLVSEDYIKSQTNADWNLSSRYLQTAIRTAQEIELRSVIGECLLDALKQKIYDNEIDLEENIHYKDLIDVYVLPYMSFQVLSDVIIPISYKIANGGLMQYSDERLNHSSNADVNLISQFYENRANVFKKRLQDYLCKNKSKYPELNDCCDVNLESHHSSGIWLGGYRNRIFGNDCCGGC